MQFFIRPTLDEILTWIDVETLTLLFSMMLIVSVVSETGVFNYMGYWAFRITKGKVILNKGYPSHDQMLLGLNYREIISIHLYHEIFRFGRCSLFSASLLL